MLNSKQFMDSLDNVRETWGDEIVACALTTEKTPMLGSEFIKEHCVACGGNWGGMLLSGIKKLYPKIWDLIPEKIGNDAFFTICDLLILLGVDTSE